MKHATFVTSLVVALSCLPAAAQESSPGERAALAHRIYDATLSAVGAGVGRSSDIYDWSVRWMRADLEGHVPNAMQAHFDRMNTLLAMVHGQVVTGTARPSDELAAQYYVAEARAWLAHPPAVP